MGHLFQTRGCMALNQHVCAHSSMWGQRKALADCLLQKRRSTHFLPSGVPSVGAGGRLEQRHNATLECVTRPCELSAVWKRDSTGQSALPVTVCSSQGSGSIRFDVSWEAHGDILWEIYTLKPVIKVFWALLCFVFCKHTALPRGLIF